jgi:hypothetical protein
MSPSQTPDQPGVTRSRWETVPLALDASATVKVRMEAVPVRLSCRRGESLPITYLRRWHRDSGLMTACGCYVCRLPLLERRPAALERAAGC